MTRTEILDMISAYSKAELAVLKGQSYSINGRSLSRSNLAEIREGRQEWEQRLSDHDARLRGGNSLYSLADFR